MGRKGDITTKVIGVRAPIKVYTKLLNEASDKGISLSEYCVVLLSQNNFSQGGQTKIEYRDKIVEKIVEIPKIVLQDRITVKRVEIDNPKIIQENVDLKKRIQQKDLELKKLASKKYTTSPTKNKEECHPDYEWIEGDDGMYIMLRKFKGR